jgi:AraC-like DNA-binding protein
LRAAGIRPEDVGTYDVFIPFRRVISAVESAAVATSTTDFGLRLAGLQGIEILGPVGVAARTAGTVADALEIFGSFMAAYSPAISATIRPGDKPGRSFFELRFLVDNLPPTPQSMELSLGVASGVLHLLLGAHYAPVNVNLPHKKLSSQATYRRYFACPLQFEARNAGFTVRTADLAHPLSNDQLAHDAVVGYLNTIIERDSGVAQSVRTMVRQLLPTGAVSLEMIATQLNMHPKMLQRRLSDAETTFHALTDEVRHEAAAHYLRDTDITLAHLTRELGYSEQSVLTRSCRRWFGCGPSSYRRSLRSLK